MFIEESVNESYINTLNLGCFPKSVLDFQESQNFFQQITFVDYQLQLLVQNEFHGQELLPCRSLEDHSGAREKLRQLISYAHSITANYSESSKTYEEVFYYTVVLAHLLYLDSDIDEMHRLLADLNPTGARSTSNQDFIDYLKVRYNALSGLTGVEGAHTVWMDSLLHYTQHFNKSDVAGNHWIELIYDQVLLYITNNGSHPLTFENFRTQKFAKNTNTYIALGCYLLKPSNKKFITSSFKLDFKTYVNTEVKLRINAKAEFPNADATHNENNVFVDTLFESLNKVPQNSSVLSPTTSKQLLVAMTSRTYQSQVVLSNYIKILIEINEYDEAFAAFKTYISYVENDQEQHNGRINNLLAIIDTYSSCILNFNPVNSFVPRTKSPKKFRYTTSKLVVESLTVFVDKLIYYLGQLTKVGNLTYDDESSASEDDKLSFLYHKYNVNVLMNDNSEFIQLVSKAWFSIGYYYYYLSTYDSPTLDALKLNKKSALKYYKNSLIVNSTGHPHYLHTYALALAYDNELTPSLKLCKFILKKYPESFKTWNLLVLLLSSLEHANPEFTKKSNGPSTVNGNEITKINGKLNGSANSNGNHRVQELKELEKFINNALNIAGLFIAKHQKNDIKLTLETKFEILQLKLTQLAVWEQIHGVQYILDYLPEVFILFHELFDNMTIEKEKAVSQKAEGNEFAKNKWSHRPSIIDPSPEAVGVSPKVPKDRAKNTIKRLSKIGESQLQTHEPPVEHKIEVKSTKDPLEVRLRILEKKILQEVWLWTSKIYLKIGLLDEAEQCIVEAETAYQPNIKTFSHFGLLTSQSRKFLSLQEFERSLELLSTPEEKYNRTDYSIALLGLCKLFIIDDKNDSSLFISNKDLSSGLIRLKNMLEQFSRSWPYGYNNSELWYYLSIIYEKFDDKILLSQSLWKCVELEDFRPVRGFMICDEFNFY